MSRIKEIFAKIKEGHPLWVRGDSAYKTRLEKAFEPFFIELENLGVDRHFAESLLFFGKEFVGSFSKPVSKLSKAQLKTDGSEEVVESQTSHIEEAEKIFGAKARDMTKKEARESKLAEKSGASIYRSMPMKGDKVGIKKLA